MFFHFTLRLREKVLKTMEILKTISLYVMAAAYTVAGLNHFRDPGLYRKIMPSYIPAPDLMILLSGIAEVILGLGLISKVTRPYAAWGVIALLIAIFPANFFMFQERDGIFSSLPTWVLIARLPFQLLLMAWAYWYTKEIA
jgi:uncharacterized membrane protein